ncbi:fimbrial protein [Serratia fonticola]|uniref:fimbrial protein n=1 Tax=Serratia fonticola TaxID=47917 RepID=UPI001378DF90|nr:fimbrial protein [Serratia fonticola]NCG55182.1 fimbrial protein [Serratia fonticola]
MRIIFSLSLLLLMSFSKMAAAYSCTTSVPSSSRSLPTITVPRDAPVGSLLGAALPEITPFSCTNDAPTLNYQEFGVKAYGTYVMMLNGRRVYSTNLAGIGYSVYSLTPSCAGSGGVSVDGTNTIGGNVDTRLLCSTAGMIPSNNMSSTPGIVFYKTGPITPGVVTSKTVGALVLRNNQSTWQTPESTFAFINFSVVTSGCTVNNSAISVNMGDVKMSAFSGVDTWPASSNTKGINIALSCTVGTKVGLRVDGNAENSAKGILKLSNVTGAASGIGIQLLYNSAPLALASPVSVGTAASTMTIPLQARYYQTQNTVTPGIANSTATFTMTYQ